MTIEMYISIMTLNVNGLNPPIEKHRLLEWIQKQDSYICCLHENHFRPRDAYRQKERGRKRDHTNGNKKKVGVAILISNKIDIKANTFMREQEGHYIMIKVSIQEYITTIVNKNTQLFLQIQISLYFIFIHTFTNRKSFLYNKNN